MLRTSEVENTLKQVYNKYSNIKLGIAGSYVNNNANEDSDIDVVIEGDSMQVEIMDYIKSLFHTTVDILWLDLMKKEDDELDLFAAENELPINPYSVYKTVIKEVHWL